MTANAAPMTIPASTSRAIMRRMGTPSERPRTMTVSVCVPTASAR